MPTLTVNGRRVTADAEHTILDAARAAGIVDIPTLCWYPKLPIVGNCRICLVSVEGQAKLLPACATKVADGMVVQTESHAAVENRRECCGCCWSAIPETTCGTAAGPRPATSSRATWCATASRPARSGGAI